MNTLFERRKSLALMLGLVAGGLAVVAAITLGIEMRAARPELSAGLVVPGLSETIAGAQRIVVTSADASYRIENTQRGWAMRDRDDYPVQRSRLEQLTAGLQQLRYLRRMTSDASKHARLGVDDPRQGGRGVLVQIEDARGALLVNLILGVEPGGRSYVRRPDQDQVWAAQGELPPLRDIGAWLDLRPLELAAGRIQRVEIAPPQGRAYILARDSAEAPWRIAAPALAVMEQGGLSMTAERLTSIQPVDVRAAPAIQGAVTARVRLTTYDGVIVDAEIIPVEDRPWLKLVARAATPEQEPAALALNERAAAWAFQLSQFDAESLTPPLATLVPAN